MAIRSQFGGSGSELAAFIELASDPVKYKAALTELTDTIAAAHQAVFYADAKAADADAAMAAASEKLERAAAGNAALDARTKELEDRIAAYDLQEAARNAKLDLRDADMRDIAMNLESQKTSLANSAKANAEESARLDALDKNLAVREEALAGGLEQLANDRAALDAAIAAQAADAAKLRAGFAALDVAENTPADPPRPPAPVVAPLADETPPSPIEPAPDGGV